MSERSYRNLIRKLSIQYLKVLGLHHWKMTRLYIGIPSHIKRELVANYPEANNGFYACIYPTSKRTFVMAVGRDVPENKLDNVIAHEMSHLLLHSLWESTTHGRLRDAQNQLEIACNRIADAVTRSPGE
jgi:hypothetical protein